jgi:hypothetical protein
MIFPDTLTVIALDSQTRLPISNVALVLALQAERKNNYCIGPIITDRYGQAQFTRRACEQGIAASKQMFLMDYYGDLLSCGPAAEIQLHPPNSIAGMIHQYETFPEFWGAGFEAPEELFAALRKAENSNFDPAQLTIRSSEILDSPEVEILLRRTSTRVPV